MKKSFMLFERMSCTTDLIKELIHAGATNCRYMFGRPFYGEKDVRYGVLFQVDEGSVEEIDDILEKAYKSGLILGWYCEN